MYSIRVYGCSHVSMCAFLKQCGLRGVCGNATEMRDRSRAVGPLCPIGRRGWSRLRGCVRALAPHGSRSCLLRDLGKYTISLKLFKKLNATYLLSGWKDNFYYPQTTYSESFSTVSPKHRKSRVANSRNHHPQFTQHPYPSTNRLQSFVNHHWWRLVS